MNQFMKLALEEAYKGIEALHGGPFGCVIVKNGEVIGKGHNEVIKNHDCTCHGEMMAIRDACNNLQTYDLSGCELYTTSEPCPMCAGAIQWANIKKVFSACTVQDAEKIGFRDKIFYESDLDLEIVDRDSGLELFKRYREIDNRIKY